jgi:hypothetical protein
MDRFRQGGSRARGSRVGDDLVAAFEEMAKHLRGEIELEAHDIPGGVLTPAQIKAIRLKVASSTKESGHILIRTGFPLRHANTPPFGRGQSFTLAHPV